MNYSPEEHFRRYRQFEALAERMEEGLTDDTGWRCVVLFYSALQLMDAYLATKAFAFSIDSHADRHRAIRQRSELRRLGNSFNELQALSERIRYNPIFIFKPEHHRFARKLFARIVAVVEPLVKKAINPS